MARGLLTRLRDLFEGNQSVRKVADDPSLMAELLLLFRMILADGEADEKEMASFRRICAEAFGIEGDDLSQVMGHLEDYGYEISAGQSIAVFREFDRARRIELARHLADIAKADEELSRHEVRLLARVIEMLDLDPQEVVARPSA